GSAFHGFILIWSDHGFLCGLYTPKQHRAYAFGNRTSRAAPLDSQATMKSRTETADMRRRKLLAALASGERMSGEDLAKELRVTRSAVWKLIRNLRDIGIAIEAIA